VIRASDRVLLLVHRDVAGVAHARWAASRIRALFPAGASAVLVGTDAFKPAEVAEELDVDVIGVVPFDPRAALVACGGQGTAKEFIRSGLVAFAREIVTGLIGIPTGRGSDNRRERGSTKSQSVENPDGNSERLKSVPRRWRPQPGGRDQRARAISP
jgi:hypothetical protein